MNSVDQSQAMQNKNSRSVRGFNNLLDALLSKGLITNEVFNSVKFESINSGKSFEDILLEKGIVSAEDIAKTLSEMRGINFIDINNIAIPTEVIHTLPLNVAKENEAVVFEIFPNKAKVAMKDPLDLQRIKYIESVLGREVEAYYASSTDIDTVLDTKYGAQIGNEVDQALEEVTVSSDAQNIGGDMNLGDDSSLGSAPIIKIVNMIMQYAVKHQASDIHIEPRDGKVSVRFRIRGVLSEKLTIPTKLLSAVVTRIKILSNLKIDEHRIPQDGRFQIRDNGTTSVDVRVSIMPSIYGEKVVMRILEKSKGILDLEKTGIRGLALSRINEGLNKTQGIILVTGPTGSGKTQTLASSLKILNKPSVNIITLEDPVEIRIDGVNQTQVNSEVGLTFASGLRAILRQDPDVIMVGEIRDKETASLAVQSALVGRLVLSTVHTNSAAGAFVRLIDMGVEPFLLSSTVNLVLGQRLVRTLCDSKKPYKASAATVKKLHEELDVLGGITINKADGSQVIFDKNTSEVTLYEAVSTPNCQSGYDGRTGIFEALKTSEKISQLVVQRESISNIQKQAIREGMITMVQDGFIKVLEGITTIEEVLRVQNN
ncbi:Flp pilus assembly complex ATPase component TadA [Candidatus Dojkabacteria bacterium]|uniref:Flp pilus assembly complex ATPase component TadA n=1 Tax=Candidatus Dojkabacteria bacterium TaxID=2099670 RepID=A0A955L9S7_9BACT|nr:Flp pilus assembly complex ATPase component TadA [Candidatus Dojkabacteria bacterium]